MITVTPALTAGMHMRTQYDAGSGKIVLAPAPVYSTDPGDWLVTGPAWTKDGDHYTFTNQDSGNDYLSVIHYINQTVAEPITFRVQASGENIATPTNAGFSIYIAGSYDDGGSIEDVTTQTNFPAGTFLEQEFTATINPTQPVVYLYAYVFARDKTGSITVRDLELIPTSGTDAPYGEWIGPITDLAQTAGVAVTDASTALYPAHVGFYYGDLFNVDNLHSLEHGIELLSQFASLVCDPADQLTYNKWLVVDGIIATGTKVYGYCSIGSATALSLEQIYAKIDACAAAGYWGMFWDDAGWGPNPAYSTRERQTAITQYAVSKGLCVLANSWFLVTEWLTAAYDATYNPNSLPSPFVTAPAPAGKQHAGLLESFFTRGDDVYAGYWEGQFQPVMDKYTETVETAHAIGVEVVGLAYHMNPKPLTDTSDRDTSFLLACLLGLDGWTYTGDTGSNYVEWTSVPELNMGGTYSADFQQVSAARWERLTDRGVIWFTVDDVAVTRAAGIYSRADLVDVSNLTLVLAATNFTATRVTIAWETSWDRLTWETLGSFAYRFLRPRVILQS